MLIVFVGVSAASVFGVPVSNYIGIHFGWLVGILADGPR